MSPGTADRAGRGGQHEHRLAGQLGLRIGARGPIERILDHAGHAMIIFGRGNDNAVRFANGGTQSGDRGRRRVGIQILIIKRQIIEREDAQLRLFAECIVQRLEDLCVEGVTAQAAGDAEKKGHDDVLVC